MKAFISTLLTPKAQIVRSLVQALGGRRWIATDAAVGRECRERVLISRGALGCDERKLEPSKRVQLVPFGEPGASDAPF